MNFKKMNYDKIEVCLDAGHAKSTPGKCSPDKRLLEYKWNRECVDLIAKGLKEHGIKYYIITPETDKDVALSTRAGRVNKRVTANKKAGISTVMISVHVNAAGNGSWMNARGWSAWTTKGKTNSDRLAECLYDAAEEILKKYDIKIRTDKSDGDRDYEGNFTVIYKSNCPAVLTENLFMDNKEDVEFLLSDYGKQELANVHVKGILNWLAKN